MRLYRHRLTPFEQSEILDFPKVWFLGLGSRKVDAVHGSGSNSGFDDDTGSYRKVSSVEHVQSTQFSKFKEFFPGCSQWV